MTAPAMTAPGSPARTGVWIGIAAISMAFAALTSAMMVRYGATPDWHGFTVPPILYFNTLVLLLSSGTMLLAHRRLDAGWEAAADAPPGAITMTPGLTWLGITMALGLLFVVGQVLAWRSLAAQGLFLATHPSSSFFYVFTALHAIHVLGGLGALGYLIYRVRSSGPYDDPPAGAAAATSLYWHFMDVLWLYLLVLLTLRL
jgi:cytochrome c oxidase subunit 3